MYEELVKTLRICGAPVSCKDCPRYAEKDVNCFIRLKIEAADAIEKLQKAVNFHKFNSEFWEDKYNSLADEKWISVNERLPKGADESGEICENVWLLFDDGCVYPGWMNGTTKKVYYLDDMNDVVMRAPISRVRAWQPGPKSPKEDET